MPGRVGSTWHGTRERGSAMERLFLGIALTDQARAGIQSALADRKLPGRVVPPANRHLTLRFLGATPAELQAALVGRIEQASLGAAFTVGFGRLGAFPRPQRARVLWLGVEQGAERLAEVAQVLEQTARLAGFAPERKPFRAHLTLARIEPARSVTPIFDGVPVVPVTMPVDQVVLFRSQLGHGPARYEVLNRFPLEENKG